MLCQIVTKALVVSGFSLFQQEASIHFWFPRQSTRPCNQSNTYSLHIEIYTLIFCYNFDHSLLFEKIVLTEIWMFTLSIGNYKNLVLYPVHCTCLLAHIYMLLLVCVRVVITLRFFLFFLPVVLNLAYVLLKFETVTYGCRMSNCQGLQSPATTYILVDAQTSSNKKNDAWWWSIRANWLV